MKLRTVSMNGKKNNQTQKLQNKHLHKLQLKKSKYGKNLQHEVKNWE